MMITSSDTKPAKHLIKTICRWVVTRLNKTQARPRTTRLKSSLGSRPIRSATQAWRTNTGIWATENRDSTSPEPESLHQIQEHYLCHYTIWVMNGRIEPKAIGCTMAAIQRKQELSDLWSWLLYRCRGFVRASSSILVSQGFLISWRKGFYPK